MFATGAVLNLQDVYLNERECAAIRGRVCSKFEHASLVLATY